MTVDVLEYRPETSARSKQVPQTESTAVPVVSSDRLPAGGEPRYELKFVIERAELARVRAWLRCHPTGFLTTFPRRRVNSVYFDTVDLACFQENLAGVAPRAKLRLRWYGDDLATCAGTFELKRKRGAIGQKPQYMLPRTVRLGQTTWPELLREVNSGLPPAWRICLHQAPRPAVLISYQREYWASADGFVRATMDYDLRVYDQRCSARPNLRRGTPVADNVIVELKCAAAQRDQLAEAAAAFPVRTGRCSKYVRGIRASLSC
ncbi:MAG: polyphosphate polymerase domain-containing protein [Planctomycetes bacterium]|nr:polyphosphate polymerase domain-containing protein [Planctomycetota bacterium]